LRQELEELISKAGGVENVMVWQAHAIGVGADPRAAAAVAAGLAGHPWCAGFGGVVMSIERSEYDELKARGARDMGRKPGRPPILWRAGLASLAEDTRSGGDYIFHAETGVSRVQGTPVDLVVGTGGVIPGITGSLNATLGAVIVDAQGMVDDGELLLGAAITVLGSRVDEGHIVAGVTIAWEEIVEAFRRDPSLMYSFEPRKMEEIVAGAYQREGFEVVLTPRSADGGKDVIATRRGDYQIRIFDQVKRYSLGHKVTADEVRAMIGVMHAHHDVNKVFVTTTSDFAPGVREDPTIKPFLPTRLQLRDGDDLRRWLESAAKK
jgi:restriction system protein